MSVWVTPTSNVFEDTPLLVMMIAVVVVMSTVYLRYCCLSSFYLRFSDFFTTRVKVLLIVPTTRLGHRKSHPVHRHPSPEPHQARPHGA